MYFIGTMSGTSADGIDLGLLHTDAHTHIEMVGSFHIPYTTRLQQRILQAMRNIEASEIGLLTNEITTLHAEAVTALLRKYHMQAKDIHAIGFHGQTIRHIPQAKVTMQIGNPAALAHLTGINVVYDFRSHDLAAGGQGAPLVPIFHQALARKYSEKNVAFLNIGGVSNITYVGEDNDELIAYDVGPGNAPMNDIMQKEMAQSYDRHGEVARRGNVAESKVNQLLQDPFFYAKWPKSLDRNHFDYSSLDNLTIEDKLATMVAFIVHAIKTAVHQLPRLPTRMIVCGGGMHNINLMEQLQKVLPSIPVQPIKELGADGDMIEAHAFAYLAARSLKGLPISFPNTTGSPAPLCGGAFYRVVF